MNGEPENEENEVKKDTERVMTADSSSEDNAAVTGNQDEKEGDPAEMLPSDHDEENCNNMKATDEDPAEEAATSEPEENSGNELPGVNNVPTSEDVAVTMHEVNEEPMSHEGSIVLEISSDDHEPSRLHHETPNTENISPAEEDEDTADEEEPAAASADKDDEKYEEYMQLLQELCEERDKASQHSRQLQTKLAVYFHNRAKFDVLLERDLMVLGQLQEYEKHINILTDLKQQLVTESEAAQQQAQELSSRSQEKLEQVENEWRAFLALKHNVAVTLLSRHLGKRAAQAKVESILAAEQFRQEELITLRLKYIKLRNKIHKLEAEVSNGGVHVNRPLQLQFEEMLAEKLKLKEQAEKLNEESLKMLEKISISFEVLANIKEKLLWSQMEVQAKREQLAEMEAMVAEKRDQLTRTKQARNSLQKDNLRLKEHRGLLGNRVLLRDFEETVDTSDQLEKQLEKLKSQQANIVLSSGK